MDIPFRFFDDFGAWSILSLLPRTAASRAHRAIIASCLEPVFSILLAALLLGEVLRPIQTLGIVFVLAAILIVQRRDGRAMADSVVVEPIE